MKQQSLVNTEDISPEVAQVNTDYKEDKDSERDGFLTVKVTRIT